MVAPACVAAIRILREWHVQAAGKENNWIKTIAYQGFFAMFRRYGPFEP